MPTGVQLVSANVHLELWIEVGNLRRCRLMHGHGDSEPIASAIRELVARDLSDSGAPNTKGPSHFPDRSNPYRLPYGLLLAHRDGSEPVRALEQEKR